MVVVEFLVGVIDADLCEAKGEEARRLGVRGGVRNCRDGSVEAIVTGSRKSLDQIIDWARKGPPSAAVTRVDVLAGEGAFESFEAWATE